MALDMNLAQDEPHPSGPHPSEPHPSGPHPSGPHPSGPHPSGPHPSEPHPSNMASPRQKVSKKAEVIKLEELFTEQDLKDTECGLGPCRARWMQPLATKESLVVLFSVSAIAQGMFFTYTVSVVSTIEKRFHLTSKQTGVMLAGNDISAVILAVFLGYYGNAGHRPRWLGLGLVLAAVSSLVAALPHLVYGSGREAQGLAGYPALVLLANTTGDTKMEELCHSRPDDLCETEDEGEESYVGPVVLLFLSQFIVGISMSIFYSVGISFIDDNISKKTTAFYYSMYLLLRVLGPVLGFLLGGKCLSLWINPSLRPNLTDQDPRWLGAWWLGFLVMAGVLVLLGWAMALYPRKLPATLRRQARRLLRGSQGARGLLRDSQGSRGLHGDSQTQGAKTDAVSAMDNNTRSQQKTSLKELLERLRGLWGKRVWVANVFNTVLAVLATSGYKIFKPKYLQHQFRQTASQANYYTGLVTLVATSLGTVLSASVLRWVRPDARFVTGYNIFVTLLDCCCYIALMFIGCPDIRMVGPVIGGSVNQSGCWGECGCSDRFSPVCSQDLTTLFYSPCYAGCTFANTSDTSHTVYSECRCLTASLPLDPPHNSSPPSQSEGSWGSATQGFCPEACDSFVYYLLIQVVMDVAYSTGKIGTAIIHLRSVADEDKGLAIGVLEVAIALFGFIPAPLIMGAIIDSSCVVWNTSCGRRGNCWVYDSTKLRMVTHLVPAGLVLLSVVGDLAMYRYSHLLDLYGEKEPQGEMGRANEEEMGRANEEEMGRANEEEMGRANEEEMGRANELYYNPLGK